MIWAGEDRYYGSTVNTLSRRFTQHKSSYIKKHKPTTCHTVFAKYGVENCKIELVELFSCNSVEELNAREGFFIRENDCVNKVLPQRTEDELREYHKDRNNKYHNENRDKINERAKIYQREKRVREREIKSLPVSKE